MRACLATARQLAASARYLCVQLQLPRLKKSTRLRPPGRLIGKVRPAGADLFYFSMQLLVFTCTLSAAFVCSHLQIELT